MKNILRHNGTKTLGKIQQKKTPLAVKNLCIGLCRTKRLSIVVDKSDVGEFTSLTDEGTDKVGRGEIRNFFAFLGKKKPLVSG